MQQCSPFVLTNHFSQASGRIATKLAHDGLQVSVHPGCAQGQGQGQRSRDTGTFVLARKSLLQDYWDTLNYSLFASSLQSTISCISIKFARWQHDCGRSLLSTIALFVITVHLHEYRTARDGDDQSGCCCCCWELFLVAWTCDLISS